MFFDVPILILPERPAPPPIVLVPLSGVDDSNELELTIGDVTLVLVIPPEVEIVDTVANVPSKIVKLVPVIPPEVEIVDTFTNVGSKTVKPPHVMTPLPAFIVLLFVVIVLQVKGLFIVTV